MATDRRFAVCVDNTDFPAALEVRKIYEVLPDQSAAGRSYLRIIDESGQDYLYPRRMFLQVKVRPEARATLVKVLKFPKRADRKRSKKAQRRRVTTGAGKVRARG